MKFVLHINIRHNIAIFSKYNDSSSDTWFDFLMDKEIYNYNINRLKIENIHCKHLERMLKYEM